MKASEQCIAAIKQFEGLRLKAYKPVATEKYYTYGYGHCGPDVGANARITEDYADFLLRRDIRLVEAQIDGLWLTLTQGQMDALVSFVFNLGIGNLKKSTLLRKVKARRPTEEIQKEFQKWVYAGGKKLAGLVKRRAWEAKMWAVK